MSSPPSGDGLSWADGDALIWSHVDGLRWTRPTRLACEAAAIGGMNVAAGQVAGLASQAAALGGLVVEAGSMR